VATEYVAIGFTILFTVATSALLGGYMFRVFTGQRTWPDPILGPIERLVLRLTGIDAAHQQDWKQYSLSLLISNVFMWLATWTIVTLQQYLPLNPDGIGNMEPALAFNTISSFTTNTNLQHYSGETGLSYFSQMFTSTFLSLLYVPVAYTYFDSFGSLVSRLFGWRPGRQPRVRADAEREAG